MKVIDKAFNESLTKIDKIQRKGWWGYMKDDTHYIMRYGHTIFTFNDITKSYRIHECCTRSDKAGIKNVLELLKSHINGKNK